MAETETEKTRVMTLVGIGGVALLTRDGEEPTRVRAQVTLDDLDGATPERLLLWTAVQQLTGIDKSLRELNAAIKAAASRDPKAAVAEAMKTLEAVPGLGEALAALKPGSGGRAA